MEVVLPSGELMRTGTGRDGQQQAWHNYQCGFRPHWDQVFVQSNFGVVTRAAMWLMPVGPTVAVWAGALIGAAYKLAFPVGLRRPSLVAFAALASFVLFGLRPTLASMAPPAVGLILAGLALYMVGAAIHHRPVPFQTPIWHGFVIVGAACHFAAVLEGVVLVPG